MKPFNLEAAKKGAKLCTRDGRPARIVCFDMMGDFPIVALVRNKNKDKELIELYKGNGSWYESEYSILDLFLVEIKRTGWINISRDGRVQCDGVFATKEEAVKAIGLKEFHVATIEIEWEEES